MQLIIFLTFLFTSASLCYADDTEDLNEGPPKKTMEETLQDQTKGLTDFFKGAADTMKEGSESGFGFFKDLGGGMVDKFGKARDKVAEHGEKIKSTLEESASNVKDEVELAASNVSYHGEKAMGFMKSLFN